MLARKAVLLGVALLLTSAAACGGATHLVSPSVAPTTLEANVTLRIVESGERVREQIQAGTIAMTSRGDFRWDVTLTKDTMMRFPAGSRYLVVYNAQGHHLDMLYTKANGALELGSVEDNVWSPLFGGFGSDFGSDLLQYAGIVRAILTDRLPIPLQSVTQDGHAAWQMDESLPAMQPPYRVRAVVDKATGVLLSASFDAIGGVAAGGLDEVRFDHLRVNARIPASAFAAPATAARLAPQDEYVHFTTLAGAAARLHHPAFVPRWLPAGFRLAAAATSPDTNALNWIPGATMGGPAVDYSRLPDRQLAVVFGDGLRLFMIRVIPVGRGTGVPWSMRHAIARQRGSTTVVLAGGAFAHSLASYWFDPSWGSSGLTVSDTRFIVFVSGDLSPREMLRVASSLAGDR